MTGVGRGRVILLNGPSSSGKSSIGRAMQSLLPDPWFFIGVDAISGMRSTVHTRALDHHEVEEMLTRTRRGYHRVVAALASVGNDVIMDYPLSEPWRLDDLLELLRGYDVTLVDVRCSVDELERREQARGDRPVGLAKSQTSVLRAPRPRHRRRHHRAHRPRLRDPDRELPRRPCSPEGV